MGRYTRGDDSWEITRDGTTLTIVANGTTTVEALPSSKLAETRERVLVNSQARAGFKLYKPPVAPVEPIEPSLPQAIVHDAINAELERAILEDPDNLVLYEVYGDWLQGQGDPRGRAIALEVGTRDKPYGDKHHAQMNRYLEEHRAYLEGGFKPKHGCRLALRLGFPWMLELLSGRFAKPLAKYLPSSAWRFLTVIHLDAEPDEDDAEGVAADLATSLSTIAKHAPASLRRLSIGGATRLDDLAMLAPRLPALREFHLVNVGDRELAVDAKCLRTIAGSPWPRLELLELELLQGSCRAEDLLPLFARTDLGKLTTLEIRTRFDDAAVEALIGTPLGRQLEILQVGAPGGVHASHGEADRVATMLLDGKAKLPALREVHVPTAMLTPPVRAALAEAFEFGDADGTDRYDHGVE